MGSRSRYTEEDILEDSAEENNFSDGSDKMYQPVDDEDSEENQEESLSDIKREVIRITSRRRQEQIPVSEPSTSFFDGNDRQQHPHNQEEWVEDVLPIGREPFTGNFGIQNIQAITNEEGVVTIPNIVEFFINEDIIDNMITKTNAYAAIMKQVRTKQFSRMSRWVDVDRREM
ncbi:unnamed protein product [Arctia plantaginis]|uniref:PiggyBac transposable element-derived protein domain-containing protein n=1 Tax=Arctia plantaginis TaxID=874455 RepID=A0A8S0ZFJ6_ARCPL|nr:unnamed protein product [Arctia plantaginis]CAB3231980.1 unnamed protein product [Arctia plantaginis]